MVTSNVEKIFFHFILKNQDLTKLTNPDFFENEFIRNCFKLGKTFIEKYNQVPSIKQMFELGKMEGTILQDDVNKLKSLYKENDSGYEPEWVEQQARGWIEYKNLDKSVDDLLLFLKTTKVSVDNVSEIVTKAKDIIVDRNNIDFEFNEGLDFFNPESHLQPEWDTFSTGYSYLDTVLGGGWMTKALYVVAGENKIGKSIWLANFAAQAVTNGHNSAVISFEMRDRHVIKRLGANLLDISMKDYNDTSKDSELIKKRISQIGLNELKQPGKLFIKEYPTSAATVKDIESYLLKMEQKYKFKFKTIFVDYINIIMNWRNPNSENTYMKIKQIAEDLRAMAKRNNWAVISLTQINRTGFGASGQLALSSIAESSGLGHTVDWMGGLIQDPLMYANNEYFLQTMLNRNEGYKNSRKKFLINYEKMRLTEDSSEMILDSITQ